MCLIILTHLFHLYEKVLMSYIVLKSQLYYPQNFNGVILIFDLYS